MVYPSASGLRIRPANPAGSFTYSNFGGAKPAGEGASGGRQAPGLHRCAPGPWGEIEYHFIYLEASEQLVRHFSLPSTQPRWSFPGAKREDVAALLDAARIPPDWIEQWLAPKHLLSQSGVLHILLPPEQLEALMPEQRAFVYAELAKSPLNEFHRDPVFITSGDVADFFRHTEIPLDHVRWFERMCYRRGNVLCFSDIPALLRRARSASEARRLFKLCSRTRAIIARLRLSTTTDCAALGDYWSNEERRKDVVPLLRSLTELGDGGTLDLIHLLPPLARKLVNSYPPLELGMHGRMPDCHWSSLNFFNYEPQDCYLDSRLAASHVLESYQCVEPPYRYGDKLFFVDGPNGGSYHSCVYIADDLVFAKNGDNAANPWILTRLEDQKQVYLSAVDGRIQAYRRKSGT
jgi:hypothetical protein